jgi:hypothetical protein
MRQADAPADRSHSTDHSNVEVNNECYQLDAPAADEHARHTP